MKEGKETEQQQQYYGVLLVLPVTFCPSVPFLPAKPGAPLDHGEEKNPKKQKTENHKKLLTHSPRVWELEQRAG